MKKVENSVPKAHIALLMVCHGNICRSPMAEFVMKDLAKKAGLSDQLFIASAATSTEEIGNGVHWGTRQKLASVGIFTDGKTAVQIKKSDYKTYDYLIGMDQWNIKNMLRFWGSDPDGKICKMLSFAGSDRDVADPWYTGDFDQTYIDVLAGCEGLLAHLKKQHSISS